MNYKSFLWVIFETKLRIIIIIIIIFIDEFEWMRNLILESFLLLHCSNWRKKFQGNWELFPFSFHIQ